MLSACQQSTDNALFNFTPFTPLPRLDIAPTFSLPATEAAHWPSRPLTSTFLPTPTADVLMSTWLTGFQYYKQSQTSVGHQTRKLLEGNNDKGNVDWSDFGRKLFGSGCFSGGETETELEVKQARDVAREDVGGGDKQKVACFSTPEGSFEDDEEEIEVN